MTAITKQVAGKCVSHVKQPNARRYEVYFDDGSVLEIASSGGRLTAGLTDGRSHAARRRIGVPQPTSRQLDYLRFIARYRRRFGVSPAEADMAQHFLLSAPSVNQMIQMLERRGFIRRQAGVPRSITIVDAYGDLVDPDQVPASKS